MIKDLRILKKKKLVDKMIKLNGKIFKSEKDKQTAMNDIVISDLAVIRDILTSYDDEVMDVMFTEINALKTKVFKKEKPNYMG